MFHSLVVVKKKIIFADGSDEKSEFLILDEPTNDLDILTLNVLQDYLMDYPGCLIIVTHDRYFMDNMVDHIFILEGEGKVKDYNGSYSEYIFEKNKERGRFQKKFQRWSIQLNLPLVR